MFETNVTFADAINLLRDVVERFGEDHTAVSSSGEGCIYAERKGNRLVPVCIVGQVVADLGALRALVQSTDITCTPGVTQYAACGLDSEMWNSLAEFGITFDHEAKRLLRSVQAEQDHGTSWGDALRLGISELHNELTRELVTHDYAAGLA